MLGIVRRVIYMLLWYWSDRYYYEQEVAGYRGWVEVPFFGTVAYMRALTRVEQEHGFDRWDWTW